jgi:hypothetical protein
MNPCLASRLAGETTMRRTVIEMARKGRIAWKLQPEEEGFWNNLRENPGDLALLAILADWYMDHDEPVMARGCRWCETHRKRPEYITGEGITCPWRFSHDDAFESGFRLDVATHARLPPALIRTMERARGTDSGTISFRDYRFAIKGLADALEKLRQIVHLPGDSF